MSCTWLHLQSKFAYHLSPDSAKIKIANFPSPLDGLNKPYGTMSVNYYRQIFNQLAREQGGIEIDWDRVRFPTN